MASAQDVAARDTAAPAPVTDFEAEADIVVCGGGGGGLPSALFSRWLGNVVILLEKAPKLGGTAAKAAFWYWVPNNEPMRALGIADQRRGLPALRGAPVAAASSTIRTAPTLGLTSVGVRHVRGDLRQRLARSRIAARARARCVYRHCRVVPDYWAELPEDKAPRGRVLFPKDGLRACPTAAQSRSARWRAAARRDGVDIRTGHRVQKVVVDDKGAVVGVEASTADGMALRVRARKAVIFATGGFTHDPELRKNFLNGAAIRRLRGAHQRGRFRGASPRAVGAQLRNMNYAWMCPIVAREGDRKDDPGMIGMFSPTGDSMIFVNKYGKPRRQREARLQRIWRRPSSSGTPPWASIRTSR